MSRTLLVKSTRVTAEVVERALEKLEQLSLFDECSGIIEVTPKQRARITTLALQSGADLERLCRYLSWAEFEVLTAQALEANGYRVINNFHFKRGKQRREIDVIGLDEPLIICGDCKHWKRGLQTASALKTIEAQIERTRALADVLPRYLHELALENWKAATLLPIVISLFPGRNRLYNGVPMVPVLQLQDFISDVPLKLDSLCQISRKVESCLGEIDKYL